MLDDAPRGRDGRVAASVLQALPSRRLLWTSRRSAFLELPRDAVSACATVDAAILVGILPVSAETRGRFRPPTAFGRALHRPRPFETDGRSENAPFEVRRKAGRCRRATAYARMCPICAGARGRRRRNGALREALTFVEATPASSLLESAVAAGRDRPATPRGRPARASALLPRGAVRRRASRPRLSTFGDPAGLHPLCPKNPLRRRGNADP